MKHPQFTVIALAALVSISCGSDKGPAPTPVNPLTGTWTGTAQELVIPGAPIASVRVTLSQAGASLSGNWSTTYANPNFNNSGAVSGSISGSSMTLTLTPSVPIACPSHVTATYAGKCISGTYAAFNCSVPSGGTVNLIQQ